MLLFKNCYNSWILDLEQSSGKLDEYLAKSDFTLQEFFSISGILNDVKANIGKFVKYLSSRKKLAIQLVRYATRLTQSQLQNQSNKKFCFIAIEILCNEDEQLIQLFLKSKQQKQDDRISEQISVNSEIQQLLFGDDNIIAEGQDPFDPQQLLEYFMNYLFQCNLQSTIQNNYFSKTGVKFLAFIINHQKYIEQILKHLNQVSLGIILIKLLTVDTQQCQKSGTTPQQCKQIKLLIVNKLKDKYLQNLSNVDLCQSIILLIQQGFISINNKHFEFPQDLVIAFNIFVNEQSINTFGNKLLNTTVNDEFGMISNLIIAFIKKLNRQVQKFNEDMERQRNKQFVRSMQQTDFILKFQIKWLIENFTQLLGLLSKPIFVQNTNINKHRFTSLLVELVKVPQLWELTNLEFENIITILLIELNKYAGVMQNDFFIIAKTFIEKCSNEIFVEIPEKVFEPIINTKQIEAANNIHNTAGLGPNLALVLLVHAKHPNFVAAQTLNKNGLDLQKIKSQSNFVLGGTQPNNNKSTKWFQSNQQTTQIFNTSNSEQSSNNIMVGNKKNISLPNLRYISEKRKAKQQQKNPQTQQQLEECIKQQRNFVIQIQQQEFVISVPINDANTDQAVKPQQSNNQQSSPKIQQKEVKQQQTRLSNTQNNNAQQIQDKQQQQQIPDKQQQQAQQSIKQQIQIQESIQNSQKSQQQSVKNITKYQQQNQEQDQVVIDDEQLIKPQDKQSLVQTQPSTIQSIQQIATQIVYSIISQAQTEIMNQSPNKAQKDKQQVTVKNQEVHNQSNDQ